MSILEPYLRCCPFCGHSVEVKVSPHFDALYYCPGCHAEVTWKNDLVPWREDHKEWNRRWMDELGKG